MNFIRRHVLGQVRHQLGQLDPIPAVNQLGRKLLGQLDWIPTLISAGLQAGSAAYGAHMQTTIAKMQIRTQKEIQERQEAQAAAAAKAAADAAAGVTGAPGAVGPAGAPSKILGIDSGVFIAGGVGLALMMGVVAVVVSKSSSKPVESQRNAA